MYSPRVILSPEDAALLIRVKAEKKLLADDVLRPALDGLLAQGLLKAAFKGSGKNQQPAYSISPEGTKALKPPKTPRAPAKPKTAKPVPASIADLAGTEARILARLEQLARSLGIELSKLPTAAPLPSDAGARATLAAMSPAVISADALSSAILGALKDADLAGRHGGLVPIPEVRRLAAMRTGASREQFDLTLLSLERDFKVDLKIANDPNRADAAEGLRVHGRGLVYFAISK